SSIFSFTCSCCPYFSDSVRDHRHLHSFPTRRSSDLIASTIVLPVTKTDSALTPSDRRCSRARSVGAKCNEATTAVNRRLISSGKDRKSTRLNSSHVKISYAVFCLKKKKKK